MRTGLLAPSILEERRGDCSLQDGHPMPYMLHVQRIRPKQRAELPAVGYQEGRGRVQIVSKRNNPLYQWLIQAFGEQTGRPVILNTSFNSSERIVNRPDEDISRDERTRMSTLGLGMAFFGARLLWDLPPLGRTS
jgi:carbamoyltransferase